MSILEKVKEIRKEAEQEDIDWKKMIEEERKLRELKIEKFNNECRPFLRKASVEEYEDWLIGFMESGGKPSHCYSYDMPNFYVAIGNFKLFRLCGASAVNIIVPHNIIFSG